MFDNLTSVNFFLPTVKPAIIYEFFLCVYATAAIYIQLGVFLLNRLIPLLPRPLQIFHVYILQNEIRIMQ